MNQACSHSSHNCCDFLAHLEYALRRSVAMSRVALLILLLSCAGCGLKGALYLPEKPTTPVVITPASSSNASSAESSADSSVGQAAP
jgi:predicted small lipoprotein YifL